MSDRFLRQHLAYFAARANPIGLAEQRGSQSISHRQARKRGYRVPLELKTPDHPLDGLLFIIHRPDGSTSEQLRLDVPIPDPDPAKPGKTHRYLNLPGKEAKGIDVHPSNLARLANISDPRILTEGVAHVDAITAAGWLGIGVRGVWMAVVKQDDGSYQLHPTVKQACPPGSIVCMGFDPDQMTKSQVHDALRITSGLLKDHGCLVLFLHVPATFNGQPVDGIDTCLAAGGTMAELIAGATTELPRLEGSDGATTCSCGPDCPDHKLLKVLQRERVELVKVDALKDVGDTEKAIARRLIVDLRHAQLRGVDYTPTHPYIAQRIGKSLSVVSPRVGRVAEALGVATRERTFLPGARLPSGQVARNHITETLYVPPDDLSDLDIVKRLQVLVKPSKRGGKQEQRLRIVGCDHHEYAPGELRRTVICTKCHEPLAHLAPRTIPVLHPCSAAGCAELVLGKAASCEDHQPRTPEQPNIGCSEEPVGPAPITLRSPFRTRGTPNIGCSGLTDQVDGIYQRARERMAAQQAPPSPPPVPDDPLARLEAEPWFAQLDFAAKNRERARVRMGVAS